MWSRLVDGRVLRFRLGGINNQNFLMYDEETGSWWQQITGQCILGPLKGRRLERIYSDEVTLATWRREHPESTAVRFDPRYEYPGSNWADRISKLPVTVPPDPSSPLAPRDLVVGVEAGGAALAVPLRILREHKTINTRVGDTPVLFLLGDGNAVRTFLRTAEFYRRPDGSLIDDASGSTWDFSGRAVSGPRAGRVLQRVQNITEFWFDWKRYHPATALYRAGESIRRNRATSPHR